eukprot:sb/3470437/
MFVDRILQFLQRGPHNSFNAGTWGDNVIYVGKSWKLNDRSPNELSSQATKRTVFVQFEGGHGTDFLFLRNNLTTIRLIHIYLLGEGVVSKQPIRTRYLGHVTGNQPIRNQYFLIRSVPRIPIKIYQTEKFPQQAQSNHVLGCNPFAWATPFCPEIYHRQLIRCNGLEGGSHGVKNLPPSAYQRQWPVREGQGVRGLGLGPGERMG